MLDLSLSSILPAALIGGLLSLTACTLKGDATDGNSTSEPATESSTSTGTEGATDAPTSTGTGGETEAPTSGGAAGACDEHEVVDACCCFAVTAPGSGPTPPTIEVGCGDQPLCPSFEVLCGDPEDFMSTTPCSTTTDAAALDCALGALAAGKAGSLQFELRHPTGGGFWGETIHYYLRGDDTAFQLSSGYSDSANWAEVVRRTLKPGTFFSDCLGADTVEAKVTCLEEATTDDVLEQCIDLD